MSKETFAYGAAVLLMTSLLNRLLAFAYRIFVVRLLGAEGMGLYEMVFPIYSLALVATTAGLPLAIAKLTAERRARGELAQACRTFRLATMVLFIGGIASALILWVVCPILTARFLPDPRAGIALTISIPALVIVPVCSALRGLFQGASELSRPATGQVVEQVVRVVVGLYLAWYLLPLGLGYAAGGLAGGMVMGELSGFIYLLFCYWRKNPFQYSSGKGPRMSLWATWGELWRFGFPVTAGRVVAAFGFAGEAVLIPLRLQAAGFSLRQATELYGQFIGIAMTLLHLPTVLTISLAATMVPAVAEATAREHLGTAGRRISDSLRLTIVGGLPFVVLYALFPHHLTHLIFGNVQAGDTLQILAWGGLFIYLQQTSTGILQGLGRVDLATRNLLAGTATGLAGIYWLTALPSLGIRGTAIAIVASGLTASYLNLRDIASRTGIFIAWKPLGALLAGLLMAVTSSSIYRLLWQETRPEAALAAAVLAGIAVYLMMCAVTGSLDRRDLGRLPWLGQWFSG